MGRNFVSFLLILRHGNMLRIAIGHSCLTGKTNLEVKQGRKVVKLKSRRARKWRLMPSISNLFRACCLVVIKCQPNISSWLTSCTTFNTTPVTRSSSAVGTMTSSSCGCSGVRRETMVLKPWWTAWWNWLSMKLKGLRSSLTSSIWLWSQNVWTFPSGTSRRDFVAHHTIEKRRMSWRR